MNDDQEQPSELRIVPQGYLVGVKYACPGCGLRFEEAESADLPNRTWVGVCPRCRADVKRWHKDNADRGTK